MADRLDKDFIWHNIGALLAQAAVFAQGLFLIPILIKSVGVKIYGGYLLVNGLLGFVFGISSFGVNYPSSRYLPSTENAKGRRDLLYPPLLFQMLSLGLLTAALFLLMPALRPWLEKEGILFGFTVIPFYFFANLLNSYFVSYYRWTNRLHIFNIAVVLLPYIGIAIIFLLTQYNRQWITIENLILIQIIAYGIVTFPLIIKTIKEIGVSWPRQSSAEYVSSIRLGFPLTLHYVTDTILTVSDRYIMAAFISVIAIGYYNPAYSLGSIILFFPRALGTALPQLLARAVDKDQSIQAWRMLDYTMSYFLFAAIPFVVGGTILSKSLLTLLANREVADNGYLVFPLVAIGSIFFGLTIILANVFLINKKTSALFRINLIAAIVKLGLNLILLYLFKNIIIAGITTLFVFLLAFILFARAAAADWPLDFRPSVLLKSLGSAAIMAVALFGMNALFPRRQFSPLFLLLEIGTGMVIYGSGIILSGAISKRELSVLIRATVS